MASGITFFLKHHVHLGMRKSYKNESVAKNTNFLFGNESADADSIVSALCYAYYHFLEDRKNTGSCNKLFVPVVVAKRGEMKLRPHVEKLLHKAGLEMSDLMCLDDVTVSEQMTRNSHTIGVVLLDHNVMNPTVTRLFPELRRTSINEIIDHHCDAGHHKECSGAARSIAFNAEKWPPPARWCLRSSVHSGQTKQTSL